MLGIQASQYNRDALPVLPTRQPIVTEFFENNLCGCDIDYEAGRLLPLAFFIRRADTSCVQNKTEKPASPPHSLGFSTKYMVFYVGICQSDGATDLLVPSEKYVHFSRYLQ